jgi:hypothetical protein
VAPPSHPVLQAVDPLLTRIGAEVIDPERLQPQDVPLVWEGTIIAGIRLAPTVVRTDDGSAGRPAAEPVQGRERSSAPPAADVDVDPVGGLDGIIGDIERHFGTPLAELPREGKQQAVRMFEENGAFSYRKSVEAVAAALGVSRFTVYNYLNRDRE